MISNGLSIQIVITFEFSSQSFSYQDKDGKILFTDGGNSFVTPLFLTIQQQQQLQQPQQQPQQQQQRRREKVGGKEKVC